ncbi:MAG TPA: hypothetical protein VMW76_09135 [Bacteroidales bacterium]|nr:hypothetical protein [Bacteroidales bacterium]
MKSLIRSFTVLTVLLFTTAGLAQDNCEVLKSGLKGTYRGECHNNLAHGYGEATGEDYYIGYFKKGLPHGQGTCKWVSGEVYEGEWKDGLRHGYGKFTYRYNGKDSVLTGKWEKDEYVGGDTDNPYVVEYRSNVGRVSFIKLNDKGNYVRIKFMRGGGEFTALYDLLLQGSSGSENISRMFTGFEQVVFPFKGKAIFTAPNAFHSAIIRCELRYRILEKGAWELRVNF